LSPESSLIFHETDGLHCLRVTDLRADTPEFDRVPTPLLLLSASGNVLTLGPLYIPGSGVCAACACHWARTAGWDRPVAPAPGSKALEVLAAMTAELATALSRGAAPGDLLRTVWEVDADTGHRRQHPVFPRAGCPRCGLLDRDQLPLSVHCSPMTGIVSSVTVSAETLAGSYSAIGSYVAPLPVRHARPLLKAQYALGKGQTKQQAIESCIGEALERYSLIYTGAEPLRRARAADVPMIDPPAIVLASDRQYSIREDWNAAHDDRYWIPERFDAGNPLDLLPGSDLISHETVYVPAACCLMWYRFPPGEARFASADSNGCGAGRTLAAATAAAVLELIERDALAIWWYNRLRRPAVLVESFESSDLSQIRDELQSLGRDLYLLDITTDIEIPVYAAISPTRDGEEPLFAAAAHPSPRVAALKAASEAAQLIFSAVHTGGLDAELHSWLHAASLGSQPYLAPSTFAAAPPEPGALTAEQLVELCARRLRAAGLRPMAVDQSSPDVLLKTVRVIVPGLRHIWARFAPGRLYDVPVRLGWLKEPLNEEELNSILCMI